MALAWMFVSDHFPLFVVFSGCIPLLTGLLCYWAATRFRVVTYFDPKDMQATYLGAITLPFSLFLAFMIGDIWSRESRYAQTVLQEVQKLDSMLDTARVCGTPCQPVDDAVGAYARSLALHEWDEGWVAPHAEVTTQLDEVMVAIAIVEADAAVPTHIRNWLLTAQSDLRRLRTDRYFILHSDLAPHRWVVVLLLGLLSQIGLAALHVGRRPQLALCLTTFSLAFALTFSYTITLAWPTVDESIIPSEQLKRILE